MNLVLKALADKCAKALSSTCKFFCVLSIKNEMGGACGPYGERERSVQGAGGKTRGEETARETKA